MEQEYVNITGRPITLTGPAPGNEPVYLAKNQRKTLPKYFEKYMPRYLRIATTSKPTKSQYVKIPQKPIKPELPKPELPKPEQPKLETKIMRQPEPKREPRFATKLKELRNQPKTPSITIRTQTPEIIETKTIKTILDIKNTDIAIGILSYNRLPVIKRLLETLNKHTNLNKITVIISDESTIEEIKNYLKALSNVLILHNEHRIGIAGNTNRLIQALKPYKHKFLLNDDIEILKPGWENFYINAANQTGLHHFCMRQPGICGAKGKEGTITTINKIAIKTIYDKPHGAFLYYNDIVQRAVGYFDESFGIYGMEHVDWSNRISLSGLQLKGYHDVVGSHQYVRIVNSGTSVKNKTNYLVEARKKFDLFRNQLDRIYIDRTNNSDINKIYCNKVCYILEKS